jgi:hypothetical protein
LNKLNCPRRLIKQIAQPLLSYSSRSKAQSTLLSCAIALISRVASVVLRSLIDHDVATGHESYRDQHASDGKEFDVSVHGNS